MLGAIDTLEQKIPNLALIDAQGSCQAPSVIDILRKRGGASPLGDVVVVHIGNNGPLTNEQFDEMMGGSQKTGAEGSVALPGPQERISWGEGGSFGECVGPSSWCSIPVTP